MAAVLDKKRAEAQRNSQNRDLTGVTARCGNNTDAAVFFFVLFQARGVRPLPRCYVGVKQQWVLLLSVASDL